MEELSQSTETSRFYKSDTEMEEEGARLCPPRLVSYLQARDPSLPRYNCDLYWRENVRQNLADQFSNYSASSEKQDEGLSVYLRVKGETSASDMYAIENDTLICTLPQRTQLAGKKNRDNTTILKKYEFTKIFGQDTSQEDLFDIVVKPRILNFINGCNSTIMAYGASGSGKTFTMMGTGDKPGIIPRALDYLFRTITSGANQRPAVKPLFNGTVKRLTDQEIFQEIDKVRTILHDSRGFTERNEHVNTYTKMEARLSRNTVGISDLFPPIVGVWVSFAEIYNESIYDLLERPENGKPRLRLKIGGLQEDSYIRGLKYVYIRSGLEAYEILHYGLLNLNYAATAVNKHSSRSHCIFSIRLIAGNDEHNCSLSVLNFCDLAGSERVKKTLNQGERLKESTKINNSLSVLGRCIHNIRDMQHNVKDSCSAPFRESKLTQLFQKALQGKEDIMMIVNINPSLDMFDDTQHALMFSAIAQQIVYQEASQETGKHNGFSNYPSLSAYSEDERDEELRQLRNELADLQLQFSELQIKAEERLEEETEHLRTTYEKMLELKDNAIARLNQQLTQQKLQTEKYKGELQQLRKKVYLRQEVVVISSSDDEEQEEEEEEEEGDTTFREKEDL